jgi:hypothetical protein
MTDPERTAELEQLLRDERALRHAAETRVAALTDQAAVWRSRADERAERIERILAAQDAPTVRRWVGSVRRAWRLEGAAPAEDRPGPAVEAASLPTLPVVRVAAAVTSPDLHAVVAAMDVVPLSSGGFAEADLVVIEPAAYEALSAETRGDLETWAGNPGRSPLVVAGEDVPEPLRELLTPRDVVTRPAGSFDPHRYRPGAAPTVPSERTDVVVRDGASIHTGETGPVAVSNAGPLLRQPPPWLMDLAASGVGIASDELDPAADLGALGVAARRWAYRHHAPWEQARALLALAGVAAPDPTPRVAGILVSHRPDDLPGAVERFLRQTHPITELVVGVHGATPPAAVEAALAAVTIPTTLLSFDRALTLGECLNRAIDVTAAPVLAKIDDDDHYGPAYLEDAVHALHYSGAPIVGKGAQFTYVESVDRTVLRRARNEETFLDGSPTGATLVFRRSIWEQVGFPHRPRRVDVLFLRGARRVGAQVYANSRWEFCYVRRNEGHTWATDDQTFLAGSAPAWTGFQPERVEVPDVVVPG